MLFTLDTGINLCLHSLVSLAAEVIGAEAEQEVGGWRGQKWKNVCMEHLSDKGVVLHFSLSEIGQSHFWQSLQCIGKGSTAAVGYLQLETLHFPSHTQRMGKMCLNGTWIYHCGEWFQRLVKYWRCLLEEKLPNSCWSWPVTLQGTLQQCHQVVWTKIGHILWMDMRSRSAIGKKPLRSSSLYVFDLRFSAWTRKSYQMTSNLSNGKVAQCVWGVGICQCCLELLWTVKTVKKN